MKQPDAQHFGGSIAVSTPREYDCRSRQQRDARHIQKMAANLGFRSPEAEGRAFRPTAGYRHFIFTLTSLLLIE